MANVRKIAKIAVISLGSVALALVLTVSALLYWVLYHPASVWNFASRYFLPADLKVTWESIDYKWRMHSWREWQYSWSTKNFLVTKGAPQMDVGVPAAEVKWSINLWTEKPFFDFEHFILATRENSFVQIVPSTEPSPEQSFYQTATTFLGYLSNTNRLAAIQIVNVTVPKFEVRFVDGAPWVVTATIFKNFDAAEKEEIHLALEAGSQTLSVRAQGFLNSSHFDTDESFLSLDIQIKDTTWSVDGKVTGIYKEDQLLLKSVPKVTYGEKKKTHIQPDIHLRLQEEAMDLESSLKIIGIPGPIVQLDRMKLKAHVPLENDVMWSEKPASAQVESPVDLFLIDKNMRAPIEKACRCKLPEEFMVRASSKAWLSTVFGQRAERAKAAEVQVKIDSVQNKLFSVDFATSADVFKQVEEWTFEPRLKADVVVHSFQGLRQFLDAKGIMIPAPLDVLDGTLTLKADSPIARDQKSSTAMVRLDVDLKSKTQTVVAGADVEIQLANTLKALELDVDAVIQQMILELPPLDPVMGIPALSTDSRIVRAPKKKSALPEFVVHVFTRVSTANPGAIQLLFKYAKPHVPVSLSVHSKDAVTSGFVRIEPFQIHYLRRTVHVENVQLSLAKDDEDDLPLNGKFRIEQGGYKIFITLKGTAQSPAIGFTSDPVLSKDDIISVLLYGRVSDQLVSAEAETAGNLNAAMADRAIGLFGLWAFASTPIQSFSYNSTTKTYTATVDLGDGLTAGVGTNWERSTNFELRKRLSRRWMLTAAWSPSVAQNARQEGRIVLQWEKRYGLSAADAAKQTEEETERNKPSKR